MPFKFNPLTGKFDLIRAASAGDGDVVAPATNTDNYVPQWNGANSKTLKDGMEVVTTIGDPGSDTKLGSEQGIREAIDAIGDKTVKATYFATIASGTTTGTISKPAGGNATLVMDEWGTDTYALLSTMANGKPTFKSPVDASGNPVTTTFNTNGDYTFSGPPSPAADHALVYVYTCKLSDFLSSEALWESELLADAVLATDFDAQSILAATTKNAPTALVIAEGEIVGRASGGNVDGLTAAQVRTIINVENGAAADQTGAEIKTLYEAEADTNVYTDSEKTKLSGIETGADVTDATNVNAAGAAMESDFDANTILKADSDNTPAALTVAEQRLVGRITAGVITALTAAQVRTLLNVADGAIANLSEDTTPQLGGDLDLVDYEILLDSTPGTDHTASGDKAPFTNGNAGAVAFGDVCYVAADGDLEFADADAAATMPGFAMALAAINAAASGEWLLRGFARNDAWTWTPGGLIYVSVTATTGNTLTQTAPSGAGDQVQIVGIATHADRMWFNPSLVLVEIAA